MKTVLLTSTSYRHRYIGRCLQKHTDLKLVVTEAKSSRISETNSLTEEEALFQKQHFQNREEAEIEFFGQEELPSEILQLKLPHGEINSELTLEVLKDISPDYILLFGTSIIQKKLLDTFPNQFINLHLGLSPWYKGSATNLFPLIDGRPEFVGATFHLATTMVDAGAILHQFRPELKKDMGLHEIGNAVIEQAGEIFPKVLDKYNTGKIIPQKQKDSGIICRIKDLNIDKLRKAYKNFEKGMLVDYLNNKSLIDRDYPIISNL
ncbi:hypothetical protein MKO06_00180 [Gramella sp. GC03-9]|uniref:phosphoribosylglycinamide formyltransferase 1 n=1 Tax=Christiangramia oceanisediminis TaxID=2920386 RepID=A0A9X2HZ46_9FLAO|nr:formyltransferase family protein [Gramella oceanisediminis]MCP9198304.1 hypothetical protein [Gramella oceanisediminis]